MNDDDPSRSSSINANDDASIHARDMVGRDVNIGGNQINVSGENNTFNINSPIASASLSDAQIKAQLATIRQQLLTNPNREVLELLLLDTNTILASQPFNREGEILQHELVKSMISELRHDLLVTTNMLELSRLQIQIDVLLHKYPHDVSAKELARDVNLAMN